MSSGPDKFAIEVLPIAQEDANQAFAYIAADNIDAADRLLISIAEALDLASRFPFSGVEVLVGGRRQRHYFRLYVHPYCIYYRVIEDRIVVMRILHERTDARRQL